MTVDGPGKRSIEVDAPEPRGAPLPRVPLDVEGRIAPREGLVSLPPQEEMRRSSRPGTPVGAWTVALPPTPDYELAPDLRHAARPGPGLLPGARLRPGRLRARREPARRAAGFSRPTSCSSRARRDRTRVEARGLSGSTGRPAPGARVSLWRYDWRKGHRQVADANGGADGFVRFEPTRERAASSHFLLARRGDDLAFDLQRVPSTARAGKACGRPRLVYTDRSIYRPGQKLFWKVLAYRGSRRGRAVRSVAPEAPLTVWLVDPNGERWRRGEDRTTNASARPRASSSSRRAGLLGAWRVESSLGRRRQRPRRGVQAAHLRGVVPGAEGAAAAQPAGHAHRRGPVLLRPPRRERDGPWRVTRETVYPWWWWLGLAGAAAAGAETVAAGTAALGAHGTVRRLLHAAGRRATPREQRADLPLPRQRRRHRRGRRDARGEPLLPARLRLGRGAPRLERRLLPRRERRPRSRVDRRTTSTEFRAPGKGTLAARSS